MIAVDTSVAVAGALTWHVAHERALPVVARERTPLLAPVAVETYSVLTRLPGPQRVPPAVAHAYLTENYVLPPLALAPAGYERLLSTARLARISGGAVYDLVVAATAREAGVTLVTLDTRAARAYEAAAAPYRLLE
jgi:predicted nucleic acid-binding protein